MIDKSGLVNIPREAASRLKNQDMIEGVKLAIEVLEASSLDAREKSFVYDIKDILELSIKIALLRFPTKNI